MTAKRPHKGKNKSCKMILSYIMASLLLVLLMTSNLAIAKDLGVIQPYLILGGTKGSLIEQFNEPEAVAFMKDGRLLAGDTKNGRFKIYTISDHILTIQTVGEPGRGPCQFHNSLAVILPNGRKIFNEVSGIASNSKDEIYVVDQGNRRLLVFDASGVCLKKRTIDLAPYLVPPDPAGGTSFTSIQGLAIDELDNIYLTDTGTRRIYKFRKDGTPDPKFHFQLKDANNKHILNDPESMVIRGKNLYVADENHQMIKVFDRVTGGTTGKIIGHPDLFERDVEGLAIYQDFLFAINEESGQVMIFDLIKEQAPLIGYFGKKGLAPGRFLSADGVAVSSDGKYIAVADQVNFMVQVFLLQEILEAVK